MNSRAACTYDGGRRGGSRITFVDTSVPAKACAMASGPTALVSNCWCSVSIAFGSRTGPGRCDRRCHPERLPDRATLGLILRIRRRRT